MTTGDTKRFHERHPLLFDLVKRLVWLPIAGIVTLIGALAWEPSRQFLGAEILVSR